MTVSSKFVAAAVAGGVSALTACVSAGAAEINVVITGGPVPEVMETLAPMFEQASGNKVKISRKGGHAIVKDVKDGAAIDLIVSGREVVDELVKDGLITSANSAFVMQSRVG